MKGTFKRILTVSIVLVFILSAFSILFVNASALVDQQIDVVGMTPDDKDAADANFWKLYDAVGTASERTNTTVKISEPGTYYIGKSDGAGAIKLRSNTTLDLNGSTLIRAGMLNNVLQCCDFSGDNENGRGYTLASNIKVMNGTIDGGEPCAENKNVNLLNFGHASGITFDNVTLKRCQGGHLIEFTGCENITITNCVFDAYTSTVFSGTCEAIQFDICVNEKTCGSGNQWNGVYCKNDAAADNTTCRNILVDNCSFLNYPSGIGNHKGVKGKYTSNVTITNCYFNNKLPSSQTAIWAYAFSDCVISNNSISGNYSSGIYVSGCDGTTVSDNSIILNTPSVYVTVAGASYVLNGGGKTENVYTTNCKLLNNSLSTVSDYPTVCVYSGSHLSEFSGNTVAASNERAISISGASKIDSIENNIIESTGVSDSHYAIHIAGSTVGTLAGNTIKSEANALQASSSATITDISKNTVTSANGDGIHISGSTADNITGNTVYDCPIDAIAVISSSTSKNISNNKITKSGNNAIRISSSTAATVSGNIIDTANTNGIEVSKATVNNITGNYINKCKECGIFVSSAETSIVKKIYGNAIFGSSDYGIRINNSGLTVQIGNNAVKYNSPEGIRNKGKTTLINKAAWCKAGNKWFYFNADGTYKTGWQKISKKWYYFDKYGQMATGWQKVSNKWYYFNSSGVMLSAWQKISGKWYYFESSGAMVTGWKKLSGVWYYFQSSGAMKTGWLKLSGKWYYFKGSGSMLSSCSQQINGKTYNFDKNGVCLNP